MILKEWQWRRMSGAGVDKARKYERLRFHDRRDMLVCALCRLEFHASVNFDLPWSLVTTKSPEMSLILGCHTPRPRQFCFSHSGFRFFGIRYGTMVRCSSEAASGDSPELCTIFEHFHNCYAFTFLSKHANSPNPAQRPRSEDCRTFEVHQICLSPVLAYRGSAFGSKRVVGGYLCTEVQP